MFESFNTTLIFSNEEMTAIMKLFKSFEKSGLLIKGNQRKTSHKVILQFSS